MDIFNISGKKAIITGGCSGLGKGMAEALNESGVDIAIIDISDKIYSVANEFKGKGAHVFPIRGDLSKRDDVEKCFNEAYEKLQGIDILVNCAGIQIKHKSEEFPLEDWDKVLEINLTSVFYLCQLAGKKMLKKKYGKIINIASMTSFFGGYSAPAYAASKGGISQLTKTLSNDWAAHGINVNAIAPGFMATDLSTDIRKDEERNKIVISRIAKGRWGTPDDLKGITIFLSSKASDYITGTVIPVDGGYLAK